MDAKELRSKTSA